MTKILILGKQGQVAWELQVTLATLGNVTVLGSQELDLASPDRIRDRVRQIQPDIIVNAAAYTAVDRAENEPDLCMSIDWARQLGVEQLPQLPRKSSPSAIAILVPFALAIACLRHSVCLRREAAPTIEHQGYLQSLSGWEN
jgi:hypothetical protein